MDVLDELYAAIALSSQEYAEERFGKKAKAYVESVEVRYRTANLPSTTRFLYPEAVQANVRICRPHMVHVTIVKET